MSRLDVRRGLACWVLSATATIVALFKLISYRSAEPWVFGRYSLPYFVFLVVVIVCGSFLLLIFYRFKFRAFYLLLGIAMVLCMSIAFIEVGGQIYAFFHPSYVVLSFAPDRFVGWKLVPNLNFTWAGHDWYAKEFSVPVNINSTGFFDLPRVAAKPKGSLRIALLGDSMVQATQVPFPKTAGRILEKRLNTVREGSSSPSRYEVLNFGVSNYSVGQYLLTFEHEAARFSPDYVFIFVSELQMNRTGSPDESSTLSASKRLSVRPTFRLVRGELIREPAKDYDEFVNAQKTLIENEFRGQRIARRKPGLFVKPFLEKSPWRRLIEIQRAFSGSRGIDKDAPKRAFDPVDNEVVQVNLKVIEELGRKVRATGGRLVVVDVSHYFRLIRWETLPATLQAFCRENELGWIPLGDELLNAERKGIATRWAQDQHFNEMGNEMFADAMYRWMLKHGTTRVHG